MDCAGGKTKDCQLPNSTVGSLGGKGEERKREEGKEGGKAASVRSVLNSICF